MGGARRNTIEVPNIDPQEQLNYFAKAASAQEVGLRTGLEYYEAALEESVAEMRTAYDQANKTLAPLSESSNAALDETMRMLNLDPIRRDGVPYKGKYTPEEVEAKIAATPGYQFQMEQGTKAIERQGAAKGMLGSGNTLLALQDYGQQLGMGYFQGYLENLSRVTESGKQATYGIAANQVGMGQIESQASQMAGVAQRETEMGVGQVKADKEFRSAEAVRNARLENMNNAYRYFATVSNKAAQDYATSSANSRAAGQLGFQQQQFQYQKQQGIDAYNQSQGGFDNQRVGGWIS